MNIEEKFDEECIGTKLRSKYKISMKGSDHSECNLTKIEI